MNLSIVNSLDVLVSEFCERLVINLGSDHKLKISFAISPAIFVHKVTVFQSSIKSATLPTFEEIMGHPNEAASIKVKGVPSVSLVNDKMSAS